MSKDLDDIIKDFRKLNLHTYKDDYKQFEIIWDKIQKQLTPDLINHLKDNLQNYSFLFTEGFKLQIELVIDTNILYGEILAILNDKLSYLSTIIDNPYLTLYAPPEIESELINTINEDLPRKFDKSKALILAHLFFKKISILEGYQLKSWNKAYSLMSARDEKDVVFLALAFDLNTHGILTRDKDFTIQKDFKIWELGECGRLITDLTKGSFSFYFLDKSITFILPNMVDLGLTLIKIIVEIFDRMITSLALFYEKGKKVIKKMPNWIKYAILGLSITIPILKLISSEQARKKLIDFLKDVKYNSRIIYSKLKESYLKNLNTLKKFIIDLEPFISYSLDGINYLLYTSYTLFERLHKLENRVHKAEEI